MNNQSTTPSSCLFQLFDRLRIKPLSRGTSPSFSTLTRAICAIGAASLVLASTGLGAFYAWSVGSSHGPILAGLFVLFAVGLELTKGLSVATAFDAFRSLSLFRGAALALLAAVAVLYSLTAELSLIATTRMDTVATREASIKLSNDAKAEHRRAEARYDAATAELTTLKSTRPAKELQADIDGLLLTPGAGNCVVIDGPVTRSVCPQVSELRKELARAERRAELEAVVATPLPVPAVPAANEHQNVGDADPASTVLATYLALLGITVAPAVIANWLVLVPVLALEVGSTLSVLLVRSVADGARVHTTCHAPSRKQTAVEPANLERGPSGGSSDVS